jgi:Fur family ferric uptake transcriptional regulator
MALLRARGGRATATRRAIVEVLLGGDQHRHLSADQVAAEVRVHLPDVAESTIYRTLNALEELEVVTHVHLGHGASTFHVADQSHRHLVCRNCDTVIEIPGGELDDLAVRLRDHYGFTMAPEHFAIIGTCPDCQDPTG